MEMVQKFLLICNYRKRLVEVIGRLSGGSNGNSAIIYAPTLHNQWGPSIV